MTRWPAEVKSLISDCSNEPQGKRKEWLDGGCTNRDAGVGGGI